MDITKYILAKELEKRLSPLIDIAGILSCEKLANSNKDLPQLYDGRFEFKEGNRTLLVSKELNDDILQVVIKHRDKLQQEFEKL